MSAPAGQSGASAKARIARGFEATNAWIFDLDNTLYPAECNLFAQVDHRMGEFIANFLGVPYAYARHLQKSYYRQFGTTLAGMMLVHKMDPKPFLDYVHDIDLSVVDAHAELAAAIEKLPGRKLIYTNGSRRHAERVAGKLGVLHLFEGIFDIEDAEACDRCPCDPYIEELRRWQKTLDRPHSVEPDDLAGGAGRVQLSEVQEFARRWREGRAREQQEAEPLRKAA